MHISRRCLEDHLERELDLPAWKGAGDGAKFGARSISTGRLEVGHIQSVEHLTAKLQGPAFAPERELLVDAKIEILVKVASPCVATRVAVGLSYIRGNRDRIRVEILCDGALPFRHHWTAGDVGPVNGRVLAAVCGDKRRTWIIGQIDCLAAARRVDF